MAQLTPEQQQKNQNVISAGRGAYRMNILVTGNPHSKQPYRDLWDKGWRLEKKLEDAQRRPRDFNRKPFKKPGEAGQSNNRYQNNRQRTNTQQTGRTVASRPQQSQHRTQQPTTVITDKLVQRFNNRHQTKA